MPFSEPIFRLQRDLARLGIAPGPLDGQNGSRTQQGLRLFQTQQGLAATGKVSGVVLAALHQVVARHTLTVPVLRLEQVRAVSKHFPDTWLAPLNASLVECGLHSPLRIAHYVGQLAHESAGFKTLVEYADGSAYEGRADLGNTEPGDGPRYKGRGVIQLTGRTNYQRYGERLGLPLEAQPELAADPDVAFRVAGLFWLSTNLNTPADADDIETITRRINGGLNGLDDRRLFVDRGRTAFAV